MKSLPFESFGKKSLILGYPRAWLVARGGLWMGVTVARFMFPPFPDSSWLQRDVLCLLLLPVVWEQRVSHDRSALPFWGGQHCILERAGRVDC